MSTTLLPFLYQTRTLQRLSGASVSPRPFRALVHSTARCCSPRHRHRPRHRKEDGDIPFELPEGYEPPEKPAKQRDLTPSGKPSTITPSERHTFSLIFKEIAARNSARGVAIPPHLPPPSDDADKPAPSETPVASRPETVPLTPSHPSLDSDDFPVRTTEPKPESIRDTINIIIQDAAEMHTNARRHLDKPFDPLHPLAQTTAAFEWEKALLRFPPRLRKAARMALGVIEADREAQRSAPPAPMSAEPVNVEQQLGAQIDLVLDPLSKSVQNEALRREERRRVETKMREAKTDFELWDVLEQEVFPMVQRLGLGEKANNKVAASKRKPGSKHAAKGGGGGKLSMHIYGPLYPSYLLLALRLLDTQFARSSPLALHLLARVKELGVASYVLGVSTPFYNELARILWHRRGDPTAVFNLLEEMRVAGLYCDESTRDVVDSIDAFLQSVRQGQNGPFLGELATLPEFEFAVVPRVRHWLKTIQTHIYVRTHDLPAV